MRFQVEMAKLGIEDRRLDLDYEKVAHEVALKGAKLAQDGQKDKEVTLPGSVGEMPQMGA